MSFELSQFRSALAAADHYVAQAHKVTTALTSKDGKINAGLIEKHQRVVHGYAWLKSTTTALQALLAWAERLQDKGQLNKVEQLSLDIAFGEYLAQLLGGVMMGQNEMVRPADFGLIEQSIEFSQDPSVQYFVNNGNTADKRKALADFCRDGVFVSEELGDEFIDAARNQYRRFTEEKIVPYSHQWHLDNALIPDDLVAELAELGTFGVCIPEEYDGLGQGKLVMSIITEELSRGWIAAGSLGTRSEIAGDLIHHGGTERQRQQWLPKIASGEILPTAVFGRLAYTRG